MNRFNVDQHGILPKLRSTRKHTKALKKPLPYSALASPSSNLPSIYGGVSRSNSLSPKPLYRVTHYGVSPKLLDAQNSRIYFGSILGKVSEEISEPDRLPKYKKEIHDIDTDTSKSSLKVRLPTIRLEG